MEIELQSFGANIEIQICSTDESLNVRRSIGGSSRAPWPLRWRPLNCHQDNLALGS